MWRWQWRGCTLGEKGRKERGAVLRGLLTTKRLCLFCVLSMSCGFDKLTGLLETSFVTQTDRRWLQRAALWNKYWLSYRFNNFWWREIANGCLKRTMGVGFGIINEWQRRHGSDVFMNRKWLVPCLYRIAKSQALFKNVNWYGGKLCDSFG